MRNRLRLLPLLERTVGIRALRSHCRCELPETLVVASYLHRSRDYIAKGPRDSPGPFAELLSMLLNTDRAR